MIQELQMQIDALSARIARLEAKVSSQAAGTLAAAAEVVDLSDPYSNPKVHKDPKFWEGVSYEGRQFSECPPDYLEALSRSLNGLAAWHDQKKNVDEKGRPKSFYSKRDAARALAHAKANRAKFADPEPVHAAAPAQRDFADALDDGELPF